MTEHSKTKPAVLYHGSPHKIEGGQLLPKACQDCLGRDGRFIFAGECALTAYVYALNKTYEMCHVDAFQDTVFCVIVNRSRFLEGDTGGMIYEVSSDHFERVTDGTRNTNEWVSLDPIDISAARTIAVGGIEHVMQKGIQVFFVRDEHTRDDWFDFFEAHCGDGGEGIPPAVFIKAMKQGLITHENAKRDINAFDFDPAKDCN